MDGIIRLDNWVPFDPVPLLASFEIRYPEIIELYRRVGMHPTESSEVINPYTKEPCEERFANIGEHCLATGYGATILACANGQLKMQHPCRCYALNCSSSLFSHQN